MDITEYEIELTNTFTDVFTNIVNDRYAKKKYELVNGINGSKTSENAAIKECEKRKFNLVSNVTSSLVQLTEGIGSHSLKMLTPRADITKAFYVEGAGGVDYFGGTGAEQVGALAPIITSEITTQNFKSQSVLHHVLKNTNEKAIVLRALQKAFLLTDEQIQQMEDNIRNSVANINEMTLHGENVNQIYIQDGDESVLATVLSSIDTHCSLNEYEKRKNSAYFIAESKISEQRKILSSLDVEVDTQQTADVLANIKSIVCELSENILHADSGDEEMLTLVDIALADATMCVENKFKYTDKVDEISKLIKSQLDKHEHLLEKFTLTAKPQNIGERALRASERIKIKSSFPVSNFKEYYAAKSIANFVENGGSYPLVASDKAVTLIEHIERLANSDEKLFRNQQVGLERLVKACSNVMKTLISKTEDKISEYKLENNIECNHTTVNVFEALRYLKLKKEHFEFVRTEKCKKLFNGGYN